MIRVREIDMERDLVAVEELEKRVEVGSLIVDELGDPMFRIRHAPDHIMLVSSIYSFLIYLELVQKFI